MSALGQRWKPNRYRIENDTVIMTIVRRNGIVIDILLDKVTHDKIKHLRWCMHSNTGYNDYAWQTELGFLHRYALGIHKESKLRVDHINRNKLDCRLTNLRIADSLINARNHSNFKSNRSGFNGIGYDKFSGKWKTRICVSYKSVWLGRFTSLEQAKEARKNAEDKYWSDQR